MDGRRYDDDDGECELAKKVNLNKKTTKCSSIHFETADNLTLAAQLLLLPPDAILCRLPYARRRRHTFACADSVDRCAASSSL